MPEHFVTTSLVQWELPIGSEIVALARLYDVSVQAITFRLMNLGIPVDLA